MTYPFGFTPEFTIRSASELFSHAPAPDQPDHSYTWYGADDSRVHSFSVNCGDDQGAVASVTFAFSEPDDELVGVTRERARARARILLLRAAAAL